MVKKLTEEELGMGRTEVCDVLKMILDRSAYPIYLADVDGESHSTLVIACLRKLQGWHMDSILGDIERYLPDYQNSPLANFVAAFSSSDTLQLPPPPYPDWLWPTPPVGRDPEIASDGGDDEDDDEGDDEDDEDDSNEYRTAPPSESLYMSALDLAEVSRKDGRSMDDNLLARLRK
ncbi:hypothetical protein Q5752_003344 [Cryptotrichosporon argae]